MRKITEQELPENHLFTVYWNSNEKLPRDWEFYLYEKNNEIYIDEKGDYKFLVIWHKTGCGGIDNYLRHNNIKIKNEYPDIICKCGNKSFELSYNYEIFAKCICGIEESVYSG